MPRQARLDIPGFLYHVLCRGIERKPIFLEDGDYADFVQRLQKNIPKYQTQCLAWALMPNHVHLLVRAGPQGLAPFMRSLLTGYAGFFNRKYNRAGHLFQNRYKSIVCQEDSYLLELVRYIHLNPLRAGLVKTLKALETYRWCGHAVLVGNQNEPWQDRAAILKEFGNNELSAIAAYQDFLKSGFEKEPSLAGSDVSVELKRQYSGGNPQKSHPKESDPQIAGDEHFAETILAEAEQRETLAARLRHRHISLQDLTRLVAQKFELPMQVLTLKGRPAEVSRAKSVLIYLASTYLGKSLSELAGWTKMSHQAASKNCWRGKKINDVEVKIALEDLLVKVS